MKLTSELKKKENSVVDIIAELGAEDFESFRGKAVQNLSEKVEVKGFRKGNIPEDVLEKEVGESAILDEMAQLAISSAYMELLKEHDINAIGRPEVSISKLAKDNPLAFTLTTNTMPQTELPDYKKIAAEEMDKDEDIEVTDKEIEDAIEHLRKMRAQSDQAAKKEGDDAEEKTDDDNKEDEKEPELPELNDEFVKTLGNFETVDDFKKKLRENMTEEKKNQAAEKKRMSLIEAVMEKTKVDVPELLITYELDKMMHQMEHDIAMSGMKFDDYLEKIEKTKEKLREDWKDQAEKRAKMHLTINAIAAEEKLEPNDQEVEKETEKLMEQYKDAKDVDEQHVRTYVIGILTNQKVFEFLEKQEA